MVSLGKGEDGGMRGRTGGVVPQCPGAVAPAMLRALFLFPMVAVVSLLWDRWSLIRRRGTGANRT